MKVAYNLPKKILLRSIGNGLRDARQRQGMNQADLAEKAELSTVYISQIESGRKNISVDVLARLCDALNISFDDLLCAKKTLNTSLAYDINIILADYAEEEAAIVLQLLRDITSLIDLVKRANKKN